MTYQDLEACGAFEGKRQAFVLSAIRQHKAGQLYRTACRAWEYYRGLNPTIMHYEKLIYDLRGDAHTDRWAPNHKIASNFFNFAVTQENQYLLGNGAIFGDKKTKEKLGGGQEEQHGGSYDFDYQLQKAGKSALIGGVSFGFWNLDHLDVFDVTEFVPLFDEESGALRAGIRFWQIADDKPLRATLYEVDGYTEYLSPTGTNEKIMIIQPKTAYKMKVRHSVADGTEIYDFENYPEFPIIPLYGNDKKQSELVGRQGTLDAFDLINSNLVNNVDEGNMIYWAITNAGGMEDEDDQRFLERLRTMHVAHIDDDGAQVEAHTVEAPIAASDAAIATIKARLYEDFMCLNVLDLSANSKTATEIRAAYQPLDSKTDMFEYCVTKFVEKILQLAEINDNVSFKRSKIVNQSEEMQMVLSAAEYLDDETITEQVCFLLGIGDQVDEIIKRKRDEEGDRIDIDDGTNAAFDGATGQEPPEPTEPNGQTEPGQQKEPEDGQQGNEPTGSGQADDLDALTDEELQALLDKINEKMKKKGEK